MEEENQEALNTESEVNTQEQSPEPEQTTEDIVEPESTDDGEAVETDGEPKRGAQTRIRELNQRAKTAEQKVKSLEERLAEISSPIGFQGDYNAPQYNPQDPIVQDGEEITIEELNRRIAARDQKNFSQINANTELRFRQYEAESRIRTESSEVLRKYPELDPTSDEFNKELSDTVTEATEAYLRINPYTTSVKSVVEKLMKPYKGSVAREVGKVSEQIAKQTSQTALRPTTLKGNEKSSRDKSIAELEQELGIVQS